MTLISRRFASAFTAFCLGFMLVQAAGAQIPQYSVTRKLALGGDGTWDYLVVEPGGKRLFTSRSTHVQVIDLATGTLAGDIPNTPGVHGIALVPALNRGFTSNGRDSSVTIFDLKTLATLETVRVTGGNPDAIMYDAASGHVFTMNGATANVTALDPATGKVLATIDVGGKPEAAVSDGEGRIFVNNEDKSEVVVIDARKLTAVAHWSLAPCEAPTGLAIDRKNHRLFAGCRNSVMAVLDSENGKLVASIPIGSGCDGVAFDPASGLAFTSNGEGTVTVVHEDNPNKFTVVQTVPTQSGARTIALDPESHRIYLPTASYNPASAATAENPRPRRTVVPGSFVVLVLEPKK